MAEENENQEQKPEEPQAEAPVPQGDPDKQSTKLGVEISESIASASASIRGRVVSHYTEIELKKRTDAVIKVMDKIAEARKELAKLKNTGEKRFGADFKPLPPTFDKNTIDDINKKESEIKKMEDAIAKALAPKEDAKPDYGPLKDIASK